MRNIVYEGYLGPRRSKEEQLRRVQLVMEFELTPRQRRCVQGYYFENKTITQMAREDGVNKSSICRTLQRAENTIRAFLRY